FNGHVPALDIAGFFQTLMECGQRVLRECVVGRIAGKEPDHRHLRLLRARRERPRGRRATKQRDELAPPNAKCHLIPPAGRLRKDSTLVSPCPAVCASGSSPSPGSVFLNLSRNP